MSEQTECHQNGNDGQRTNEKGLGDVFTVEALNKTLKEFPQIDPTDTETSFSGAWSECKNVN